MGEGEMKVGMGARVRGRLKVGIGVKAGGECWWE